MATNYNRELGFWNEAGGEYFSRCELNQNKEIRNDDYIQLLDAIQNEFIQNINDYKLKFLKDKIKLSNIVLKIFFPSITTKQKKEIEKSKKVQDSKQKKLNKIKSKITKLENEFKEINKLI